MASLTRGQIATLTRLLGLRNNIAANSLKASEETVWIMNSAVGRKLAKTYASIVVNNYHRIGTNLPDTNWVADEFAGSRVMYCEAIPDDAIGYATVEQASALVEAGEEYIQAVFTPEARERKGYRRNQWGVQFAVGVEV